MTFTVTVASSCRNNRTETQWEDCDSGTVLYGSMYLCARRASLLRGEKERGVRGGCLLLRIVLPLWGKFDE